MMYQPSFEDLGQPLSDVTFCVIDFETTGGSAIDHAITEVGACKYRRGQCEGTYQTLVNPDALIPPQITVLTGITQAMVMPAPRIGEVLPSLLEFIGDSVIVGHNVRFDASFLQAAVARADRPRLANPTVDTCGLARRLVRDEVPNCKLGTLADRFQLPNKPTHRALDDALATADLLHVLLERAGSMGVTGLDDLLQLPTIKGHPQVQKLRHTENLPRSPGVYMFRDRHGRILYVGKATNLRTRVRSYFSGDSRRKIGQLIRETESIDHISCDTSLEAAITEVRLIHEHLPRFNRQSKRWRSYSYLKLTRNENFPRLSVVKATPNDGAAYLGPLGSSRVAKRVAEAIESAVPLRRCTVKLGNGPQRDAICAAAQLGVATCPCAGAVTRDEYEPIVTHAEAAMTSDPLPVISMLEARMRSLSSEERFEEAADIRDRAEALAGAVRRVRSREALLRAGTLIIEVDATTMEFECGRLMRSWNTTGQPPLHLVADPGADESKHSPGLVRREDADEISVVADWIQRYAHRVKVVYADHGLASRYPPIPAAKRR